MGGANHGLKKTYIILNEVQHFEQYRVVLNCVSALPLPLRLPRRAGLWLHEYMSFPWSARTTQTISAVAMSALLLVSARKHFQEPKFFAPVVPDYLCRKDHAVGNAELEERPNKPGAIAPRNGALAVMSKEEWIAVSGLLEAAAAVGLLFPVTRTAAARGTALMFTAFLAGHVDALRRAYSPGGTASARTIHTLRLPLQVPLILWAWNVAGAKQGS